MDLSPTTTTVPAVDQTWLASKHGIDTAYSVTLDVSAFTANDHYPNGYIPAGMALGKITASGKYGPYDATGVAVDGTAVLAGFLLEPVKVNTADNTIDVGGALFWHGRIAESRLPIAADSIGGVKADGTHAGDLPTVHFSTNA